MFSSLRSAVRVARNDAVRVLRTAGSVDRRASSHALRRASSTAVASEQVHLHSPRAVQTKGSPRAEWMTSPLAVTDDEVATFWRDGAVMLPGFLADAEVDLLVEAARHDPELKKHAIAVDDGEGGTSALTLWNHPGEDSYGMVMRSARVVESAKALLGGDVYHYHTKLMRKDPLKGGAFAWHQDYGYWYQNGILFPRLATVFVALDDCTRANGCLQTLVGSHEMGRLDHDFVGDQQGIHDAERLEHAERALRLEHHEMKRGDALFFHCNTLHRSDANTSASPRWALLAAFNLVSNDPYRDHHHPRAGDHELHVVSDAELMRVGLRRASDASLFMDPSQDATTTGKREAEL